MKINKDDYLRIVMIMITAEVKNRWPWWTNDGDNDQDDCCVDNGQDNYRDGIITIYYYDGNDDRCNGIVVIIKLLSMMTTEEVISWL